MGITKFKVFFYNLNFSIFVIDKGPSSLDRLIWLLQKLSEFFIKLILVK